MEYENGDVVRVVKPGTPYWDGRIGSVLGRLKYGTEYVVSVGGNVLYLPNHQIVKG